MSEDFRTGRPPTWRVVFYAIIAMAIPVYFFYPRLGELNPPLRVLFWFLVVFLGGGMVIYFAALPWIVANLKAGPPKRRQFIQLAFVIVLVFGIVCELLASIHWK
jgi:quinol-cytochrome oxidoreductase complex cytochrome b subunit